MIFLIKDKFQGEGKMESNQPANKLESFLLFMFATGLIATLGSLYFSEVLKYVPCELCWYQRIFMYPQVILLGIAIAKKNYDIVIYNVTLSSLGGAISLYHYLLQKVDLLGDHSNACGIVPCNSQYINWFGFITIPFLALTAFIIIIVCSILVMKQLKEGKFQ